MAGQGLEKGVPIINPVKVAEAWCINHDKAHMDSIIRRFARGGHTVRCRIGAGCQRCGHPEETLVHRYAQCPANQDIDEKEGHWIKKIK